MAQHPYKLLVVDIDGTLVGRSPRVSDENKQALAKVGELGIQVALSTGRSLKSSLGIIEQLSLDGYHIFFDGALISRVDPLEEVYVQPVDRSVVRQMVEFAYSHDIDLELFSVTQYFARRETWCTWARRHFFGHEVTITELTGLGERERIIKGGVVTASPEEEAKAALFCRQFADSLCFSQARTPAYPGVTFYNLLAPEVSKGKALAALASRLGVSRDEVMAVGDGTNDVSLLAAAGLAVAMGNAGDELKAIADYVTLDVEDNGLAAAINRFLL